MRIYRVDVRHFRGFAAATIIPFGHTVIMGEPGAGRSDLIEGLSRVLSPDATRLRTVTELDFYKKDTSKRAEIEVVLGELGEKLEQEFLDHLEVWDRETRALVEEQSDPEAIDKDHYDFVVRLCYRASCPQGEDQVQHWVDYPKNSDPDAEDFDRVRGSPETGLGKKPDLVDSWCMLPQ